MDEQETFIQMKHVSTDYGVNLQEWGRWRIFPTAGTTPEWPVIGTFTLP